VEQASDLCFGAVGARKGLWTVCDRNGGQSAGRIYLFYPETLGEARPAEPVVADEEFVIAPPQAGWQAFRQAHAMLSGEVLNHIQERIEAGLAEADGPRLDLEAVTIGRTQNRPDEDRLFVGAEEPFSLVLELALCEREHASASGSCGPQPSVARVVTAWQYRENDQEHGADSNDGLEGLAYAGSPGRFWWVEEGTRLHKPDAHPRLFFSDPRIGSGELAGGCLKQESAVCEAVTRTARGLKDGSAQTLNALCLTGDGMLLAVDRNGGWVLRVDSHNLTAVRWLNLYNLMGKNLRDILAKFPGERHMPYVSIEGIAVDGRGDVWLVDDPAMPEPFRASCLVRLSGVACENRQAVANTSRPETP
jgi:hypothetical protein